jgi:hypothetical protein
MRSGDNVSTFKRLNVSTLLDRVRAFFNPSTAAAARPQAAAITGLVDDSAGWHNYTFAPGDRPWGDVFADLEDAQEAWRSNFMVRRIVNVTRSYTVGSGLTLSSADPAVDAFLRDFWRHPKNRIDRRLGPICDHLTRDGELFPILFTNPVDGMSYVRFKSARTIREVRTDPDDYETELAYVENAPDDSREWISPANPLAFPERGSSSPPRAAGTKLPPLMLHWAVNKPVDATRGESDLVPILPWALRYSEWLKDRVRLNRQRTRSAMLDITVADDTQVEVKRHQLRRSNPIEAGIYVHGQGESVTMHNLAIDADDAQDDGQVLRLAIVAGSNIALHYIGEGEQVNYATAKEMGEPTARFFADRQQQIIWFLQDLITVAYRRFCYVHALPFPDDLQLNTTVTEVARADNANLAQAAHAIVQALTIAKQNAWIDDETALSLALKFAGETLPIERIRDILATARGEARKRVPDTVGAESANERMKE